MRSRLVIFLLASIVVILALMFWLHPKRGMTMPVLTSQVIQPTNKSPSSNANVVPQNVSHTPLPVNSPANQQGVVTHKIGTPEQARQEIESANAPIEFYGKVIDQDSNALAGAKVDIGIRHWTMPDLTVQLAGSDIIHLDQTSDANGRFEFHGATGDGFGVGIIKDGYELEQNKYGSGPTAGSLENPVVFKMWSTNIHEKLITGQKAFPIVPDGKPYFIDLSKGEISQTEGGDIKIWVKRPEPITSRRYDWLCEMDVLNGGMEASDSYSMFSAPAEGYTQTAFQFEQKVASGVGRYDWREKFLYQVK